MSALTRSSNGETCIKCGNNGAYSCHYNGKRQHHFGKGRSQKCNDMATAEFCHKCDIRFTEGSTDPMWDSKWERSEEFLYWCMMTNIRRWENETIGMNKGLAKRC